MKLVVWSPTALLADGIASILEREPDIDARATGHIEFEDLSDVDGLLLHQIPLTRCWQLLSNLNPSIGSRIVAGLLARSSVPLLSSRTDYFGLAGVIDLDVETSMFVTSIRELITRGLSVEAVGPKHSESDLHLENYFCPHCRDARDVEILRLIVDGHTDSQIAELMNLNAQTVRNRVSNMLLESGMSNRTQLAIDFFYRILALNGGDTGAVVFPVRTLES